MPHTCGIIESNHILLNIASYIQIEYMRTINLPETTDTRKSVMSCAKELGLQLVGITTAAPFKRAEEVASLRNQQGLMGDLPWYTSERIIRGSRPKTLLPGAKSVISVAMNYLPEDLSEPRNHHTELTGRVARYAQGFDYHLVLKERLLQLTMLLQKRLNYSFRYKIYVDDGPMIDREVAFRSAVGFFGKNTNIITKLGSWVFLGQILTDLAIKPDRPSRKSCGSCVRCIPACPTGAIVAPYIIDSNKCIAYLTIEHRGPIPIELRPLIGDMVFGCDICQEVCPINVKLGTPTQEPAFRAPQQFSALDLRDIIKMDEPTFRDRFKKSPIFRAHKIGLQRNACIVLGNLGNPTAIPELTDTLRFGESLVKGHAAWALGQIQGLEAKRALETCLITESDTWVREEIQLALEILTSSEKSDNHSALQ
ncbi:tRNA epoxyqueuosine(34) reductase QueG [SAR202 cluster bacterium AD-802-E10_MRT_200m]|nr:tRNA epoxyqueuosine(34) reductase QueG [SAR202 cluster bacterium AD-802-E10_MRT_200m]